MPQERRRWQRFNCEFPCSMLRIGDAGQKTSTALVKDVSLGGARVWVSNFVPISTRILSYLQIPRHAPIAVELKPTWTVSLPHFSRYEMGCSFEHLGEEEKKILENYQEELSRAA